MTEKTLQVKRKNDKKIVLRKGESQRKNGSYQYRWTNSDGKRHYIYAKTLNELREKEREINKHLANGVDINPSRMTLDDAFESWYNIKRGIKEQTKCNYLLYYTVYVSPVLGKRQISSIKKSDLKLFYITLYDTRNLSIASIKIINIVLRQTFDYIIEDNIMTYNPAIGALKELTREDSKKRFAEENERRSLTLEEQQLFLEYANKPPYPSKYYPLILVLLGTGLRLGEALGLTWEDIDFENNFINVRRSLVSSVVGLDKKPIKKLGTTKTKKSNRSIPMLPFVKDALLSIKQAQDNKNAPVETVSGITNFVFRSRNNKILIHECVNAGFNTILRKYNREHPEKPLRHITPHMLRHTFATRLCESGVNIKIIQEIMGHADVKITLNVYTDATNEAKQSEFEKLKSVFDVFTIN